MELSWFANADVNQRRAPREAPFDAAPRTHREPYSERNFPIEWPVPQRVVAKAANALATATIERASRI